MLVRDNENSEDRVVTGELTEFEAGSSIGLAQFEDGASTLLDEITDIPHGMLTEIELPVEFVDLGDSPEEDEPIPDMENPPEDPEVEPIEEPVTPDEVEVTPDDDDLIGDESEFIEPVDVDEFDAVIDGGDGPVFVDEPDPPAEDVLREPENPVICFVCENALDISGLVDSNGWMIEHPMVRMIKVPCAGMVKGSWLDQALQKGASGAAVISCSVENCYHRTGAKNLDERWNGDREPCLPETLDRERVRLIKGYRAAGRSIRNELNLFLAQLGSLDHEFRKENEPESQDTPGS